MNTDSNYKMILCRNAKAKLDEISAVLAIESGEYKDSAKDIVSALTLSNEQNLGECFERLTNKLDEISGRLSAIGEAYQTESKELFTAQEK